MIVYLVRHGEAVAEEVDPARPLTEKGRAEVEATAKELKEENVRIDEIWHSGKLRARQTAEIIAGVLDISKVIEKEGLKPNDSVTPIAAQIRHSNKTLLIAGHLPFLPKLASLLKTGTEDKELKVRMEDKEAEGFRQGGVVRISF